MAKKAKKSTRKRHTPPKRRRVHILPYVIMALLIIGIPMSIYHIYQTNVDRNMRELTEAIASFDQDYLEENTDRLPIILDVLKKSYSEEVGKQEEFYDNLFKNLEITVLDQEKKGSGLEVKVSVTNVNYIDVFDKIPESESEEKIHADYMLALANPDQEKHTHEAKIFLQRKFSGFKIYESRNFINAIIGGALDYADGESPPDPEGEENTDSN